MSWLRIPCTMHQSHSLQVFSTLLVSWGEGRVTPWTRRHFIAGPGTYTYTYTYTHLELRNSGRRPEYLEGTCTDTGRTCYPRRSSVWWCSWREDSRKTKSTCVWMERLASGQSSLQASDVSDLGKHKKRLMILGRETSSRSGHAADTVLV